MGLINSLASRSRVKPVTGPVAFRGDWNANTTMASAAIIRAVTISLANKGLNSSSHRGSDVLGIGSMLQSSASTIWTEQLDERSWTIVLGRATHSYRRTIDWEVFVKVLDNSTAGRIVEVSTGEYATKDGTIVHKREFIETRDLILAGFAQGFAKSDAAEASFSAASVAQTFGDSRTAKREAGRGRGVIKTRLSVDEIDQCLALLPLAIRNHGASWRTVSLGFGDINADARIEVQSSAAGRTIAISWDVPDTGDEHRDSTMIFAAITLPNQVAVLIQTLDSDARIDD